MDAKAKHTECYHALCEHLASAQERLDLTDQELLAITSLVLGDIIGSRDAGEELPLKLCAALNIEEGINWRRARNTSFPETVGNA